MAEAQQKLQVLSEQYQKFEQGDPSILYCSWRGPWLHVLELQQSIQSRQKLESQQQENKQVQKVRLVDCIQIQMLKSSL